MSPSPGWCLCRAVTYVTSGKGFTVVAPVQTSCSATLFPLLYSSPEALVLSPPEAPLAIYSSAAVICPPDVGTLSCLSVWPGLTHASGTCLASPLSSPRAGTSYQFLFPSRSCLMNPARRKILVIQTDFDDGVHSAQLVASAKYVVRACPETTWGTTLTHRPRKPSPCKQHSVMSHQMTSPRK